MTRGLLFALALLACWPLRPAWGADALVPASLPAGEDPAPWLDALALAGLRVGPPEGNSAFVLLHPTGERWTVVVRDTAGRAQTVQVPRPVTPADRESVALLAASLARPIAAPRAATVAATPVPPPARSPRPAPAPPAPPAPPPGPPAAIEMALVEAPPAPAAAAAPIPAPTGAAWSRAAGGLRVGPGSAPAVGVAAGVDSARGWRIGLAAHAWGPATAARVPVRARAAGGELLLGRAWAPGALELGLGAEGRALASGAAAVHGAVPTASASGLWYPGAARGGGLVVLARAHVDLRMTGVDTAAGVSRLAPVGVVVGAGLRGAAPRRPATFSQNP